MSSDATTTELQPDAAIDLSGDGGVLKKIVTMGSGPSPRKGDMIEAHYTGRFLDGTVFDSSVERNTPFTFQLGAVQVIRGWEIAFSTMCVGEKALLTCRADYAYGDQAQGNIPARATLTFEAELLSFAPKKKELWEMTRDERIERAVTLKKDGGTAFRATEMALALAKYRGALEAAQCAESSCDTADASCCDAGCSAVCNDGSDYGNRAAEWELRGTCMPCGARSSAWEGAIDVGACSGTIDVQRDLILACALNAALCCMKLDPPDWRGCTEGATTALGIDCNNIKGLYRRGKALLELGQLSRARADLLRARELEVGAKNRDVRRALTDLKHAFVKEKADSKSASMRMSFALSSLYNDKTRSNTSGE